MHPELGRQRVGRGAQGPLNGRIERRPAALGLTRIGVGKADVLGIEIEFPAAPDGALAAQAQPRQPTIGPVTRQGLEALHHRRGRPPVARAVTQDRLAQQISLRGHGQPGAEIFEVFIVRHAVQVQRAAQTVAEILLVADRAGCPVGLAGHTVAAQPFERGFAAHGVGQIAILSAQLQTTTTDITRHQRGVVVGRDVPIVGHGQFHAALVGGAKSRRQKARLALRHQREFHPRHIEDRGVLEHHRAVTCHADFAVVVQIQLAGLDVPVGILRLTGTPGRVFEAVLIFALEADHAGLTAAGHRTLDTALARDTVDFVRRRLQLARLLIHAHLHFWAGQSILTATQLDIALGLNLVKRFAVFDLVSLQYRTVSTQHGMTLGSELHILLPDNPVRVDGGHAERCRHRRRTGRQRANGFGRNRFALGWRGLCCLGATAIRRRRCATRRRLRFGHNGFGRSGRRAHQIGGDHQCRQPGSGPGGRQSGQQQGDGPQGPTRGSRQCVSPFE